jgi:hypothetical protein
VNIYKPPLGIGQANVMEQSKMGDVIAIYTREQAIEDGMLIRLNEYFARTDFRGIFLDVMHQLTGRIGGSSLGDLHITADAAESLNAADVLVSVIRHQLGDWGDIDEHDRNENEQALLHADRRIVSAFRDHAGITFWIITEWNGEATTVLLPEDY